MKKEILIIFPKEWLAYTPTILNLVDKLSDLFNVKVLAIDDGQYKNHEIYGDQFKFVRLSSWILKVHCFLLNRFGSSKPYQLLKLACIFLAALPYRSSVDEVIAADSEGLWIAQKLFGKCHFLSLELFKDFLFQQCDVNQIESVIIQTEERYKYLFGDLELKTFFIQNSPSFSLDTKPSRAPDSKKAVFLGNANPRNGAYLCMEAMRELEDIVLTIKGTISSEDKRYIESNFRDLLENGRIVIDNQYVRQEELIEYLSQYYIGFCFYDLNHTDAVTKFNFTSVPSGKLFNYYAAGVPVIGSNLPGLHSVKDFEAGVLLNQVSADSITEALKYVDSHHSQMRESCFQAALHFDFDAAVEPLKQYLLTK